MSEDNNLEFSADENVVPLKKVRKVRKVVRKVVAKVQEEEIMMKIIIKRKRIVIKFKDLLMYFILAN